MGPSLPAGGEVRTLSWTSRALCVAAAATAAALTVGGAYFVGYVGAVHRELTDPSFSSAEADSLAATLEESLGYSGFLKFYRNYRLTGDPAARKNMSEAIATARRAVAGLRAQYSKDPAAHDPLREAAAVVDTFTHVAGTAAGVGDVALRGTRTMAALDALPQTPQLEAAYLALKGALDRLRQSEVGDRLGGAAWALNLSQALVIAACALLIACPLVAAGLLQTGIVRPLKALEHSLATADSGTSGGKTWGVERADEFGDVARAGEAVRRRWRDATLNAASKTDSAASAEKLRSEIASAAAVLTNASTAMVRAHDDQFRKLQAALLELKGLNNSDKTMHAEVRLGELADRLAKVARALQAAQTRLPAVHGPEIEPLVQAFREEGELIRRELRDLAVRLTEDRLLATASLPALGKAPAAGGKPRRTLADVPASEVLTRLQAVSAELTAEQSKLDLLASLEAALKRFSRDAERLGTEAARTTDIKEIGQSLVRHADEIEARVAAVAPSAATWHGEVEAITRELRTIAARTQAGGDTDPALRSAAARLGAQAQALFGRLGDRFAIEEDASTMDPQSQKTASTDDLDALTSLLGRLEDQANHMCRRSVADRFKPIASQPGPATADSNWLEANTDGAIRTIFESIERLNGIAASLARAGDADRLRRTVS